MPSDGQAGRASAVDSDGSVATSGAIGPAVRKVPWVGVDCVDQRSVTPDVDLHQEHDPSEDIEARLAALGYA